ncbi:MAG: hypothetical protein LBE04_03975 [Prevotellaceae bacterium]|jgi:hypothetical protein|nr:hypothetical protein [Prevotellaceae bacterium]
MHNIINENTKIFSSIMQSVQTLHETEIFIEDETKMFRTFMDFLTKNADEIGKFHAVEEEMVDYLRQYSFNGKADFSSVKDKLQPLTGIKQLLATMGSAAKELVGYPNRYGCHKKIEECKTLTDFCINRMKSVNYDKTVTELKVYISDLKDIKKELETDAKILADIKNIINSNNALLNKYTAFKTETEQFVSGFPNDRDNDLATIKQWIHTLSEVDKLLDKVGAISTQIQHYANRYQKDAVWKQADQIISFAHTQMKRCDMSKTKSDLQNIIPKLNQVISDFDKEYDTIVQLIGKLKQRTPDHWEEDNENLIYELSAIIKNDTRKQNFVLQDFYTREQDACDKKKHDISGFERQHADLMKRYANRLYSAIRDKYVSYSCFQQWITDILEEERKRINRLRWKIAKIVGATLGIGSVVGVLIWVFVAYTVWAIVITVILIIIAFLTFRE